jgi:CubicO group peptidase (beta-lactamase class C family)
MTGVHEQHWQALGKFVAQKQKETGVPGVAVGVLYQGEVAAQGFGVTNTDHPLPVTETTLFQIGSITKTLTGTVIIRLVEEGKLELDAPIRQYVGDFKVVDETASSQTTVRHLLTHMGGWEGDFFLDTGAGDDALAKYAAALAEQEQVAPLGTHWSYNNAGFSLLGYLVEQVTGKRFEEALHEWVLAPLKMEHAFLEPSDAMTHRFVVGHSVSSEGAKVLRPWPLTRASRPAGGLITHVHDLLRYARFHLGDATAAQQPVISAASVELMRMPQAPVWGDESWGLSWALDTVSGVQTVGHGGGTLGQITLLRFVPERQFAVAVFTNASQGGVVTRTVTDWTLKSYLGLETPEPKPLEMPAEELAQFAGTYRAGLTEMELGVLAGRLVGQVVYKGGFPTKDTPPEPPPPPMWLAPIEPDRLMVMEGDFKDSKADAIRTPDGAIGWLRFGGRLHRRVS